ncbi:MAG: HEAT repeat domain-containing protein [Candidatus Riflebacteria bacterium]|nr:HEAT repeat domain-containing protein [Candidatus Riflebacteria bacterium]
MSGDEKKKLSVALTSENAEIRKKALSELKKLDKTAAIPILVSALSEKNDDIQADLGKALLAYKDAALPYLVQAFADPSWRLRQAASRIIGAMGDSALTRFLELIPRNADDVDFWMVQTLGLMGGEAVSYLVRAFKHPNHKIRLAAVRSAVNSNHPDIVPPLLAMLEESSWPLRKAAFDSLERLQHLNPQAIIDSLKNASHEAKFWVIRLAGEKRDSRLIPIFCSIIERDPEESKLEAIRALCLIETPETRKILVGFLSHRSWIIRKTAADALWEQGLGAADEVISAVAAPNADARYWSVKLLGQSNEPRAFALLLDRLQDPDSSVRAAACTALGAIGDKRAAAPLMAMMADPAEEVRTGAMLAVGQIGQKEDKAKPSIPAHLLPENQSACPTCGKQVGRNFAFCPFCLGHLKKACPKCGRAIEAGWKGCPDCGKAV